MVQDFATIHISDGCLNGKIREEKTVALYVKKLQSHTVESSMGRSRAAFHVVCSSHSKDVAFVLVLGNEEHTWTPTISNAFSAYNTCCLYSFFRKKNQVGSSAAWLLMSTECKPQTSKEDSALNKIWAHHLQHISAGDPNATNTYMGVSTNGGYRGFHKWSPKC